LTKLGNDERSYITNLLQFTDFHIELAIGDDQIMDRRNSERLQHLIEIQLPLLKTSAQLFELFLLNRLIAGLHIEERLKVVKMIAYVSLQSGITITNAQQMDTVIKLTSGSRSRTPVEHRSSRGCSLSRPRQSRRRPRSSCSLQRREPRRGADISAAQHTSSETTYTRAYTSESSTFFTK
jgi:hypothetical protein